ncbi:hypothetical protein [Methylobacterium sp. Leaf466]|uniref:hypothetical protein n=1 Tax=Methylobacterium sp. Leaf466 TaxID=1736386 RepID=UPI0006F93DE6|nr:hypothetical protein [Methylobacterium sp. Leaf466]KQT88889.1 hypothetical protein ASG59_13510 [Methylobacterium sp. Leaf466]
MRLDHDPTARDSAWRRFAVAFALGSLVLGAGAIGFVAATDPYGLRAAPGRAPGPLMDSNQRFLYPQIVRGGAYDSAVIGTSTARLLDPRDLDRALGGRFANLAMNAATPFEQRAMARLVLAQGAPRTMLLALDSTWCEADADTRLVTPRPFPNWLYEPDPSPMMRHLSVLRQVNWQSLVTGADVVLHRIGHRPARIRSDGYAVFTPPDEHYDAARAARHIHGGTTAVEGAEGAEEPGRAPEVSQAMPALDWLDALLAAMPSATTKLLAFMPVHVAVQGRPGTARGAREAACKARVAAIGRRRGATVVDFRMPSPVTTQDRNYWDPLHYRLPVAARIVEALARARTTGADDEAGFFRVLAHAPAEAAPAEPAPDGAE